MTRYIKIAIFLAAFLSVSVAQTPLEIRDNCVVGVRGIVVDKTTLNRAIENYSKNPYTVVNFQFRGQKGKSKAYVSWQQSNAVSSYTTITVKNNVVESIMVQTFGNNENEIKAAYRLISQKRIARLGYPSSESAGMLKWRYFSSSYFLVLSRTDNGKLQIVDIINGKRIAQ